ncbi:MAG TPA: relaxase/mobilization nuclease domain-containing protein [Capsulimonadaceae bacterium]|nr:relaxase/mobilization nuclease domain-containing protein [Capsulimonadaceae bacterium]
MIVKGAARSGPYQLAIYLMRVERYDTGEEVELIEFRSPWAASSAGKTRQEVAALIVEAFRDWQDLGEATKNGRDGLYRSEISPAPKYAAGMTREQIIRAADILEQELGFQGQDRVIVRHAGTDGRTHFHAVWPRVDLDTMMMIPDSFNYVAHERASKRMELEFGHEFVAGKHAKRDRERQPEFPRQDHDYAEAQMAQRTNMTPDERKEQMTAMRTAAANGQELKKALEDAGYLLAKGERGYLVVDGAGVHSVLSRNIGLKKDETAALMADVPLEALPTIEQAQAMQEAKVQSTQPPAPPVPQPPFAEMTEAERKAQISALRQKSDGAPAFKNALEEAGYLLAHGPRNGFYVIDRQGEVFNLSRLSGISGKEYKEFMAGIDPASVSDVESGKAVQQARAAEAFKPGPEESKFLSAPEAPLPSKFLSEKRGYNFDTYSPVGPTEQEAARLKELQASKFLKPPAKAPEPPVQQAVPVPPPQQVQPTNPPQAAKSIDLSYYSPAGTPEREPQKINQPEVSKFISSPTAKAPEPPPPAPENKSAQKAHPSKDLGTQKPIDLSYYSPSGVPEHEARKSEPKRSVEKQPLPFEPQPKPELGDDTQTRPWRKIDPDRKTHITSIKAMADGAQDFKRALEEAGYTLASGKGGYTLVDKEGNVFNLFAHIPENKIRLEAFMSPIPLSSLPSVEDVWKARKNQGIWVPPPPIADTPAGCLSQRSASVPIPST